MRNTAVLFIIFNRPHTTDKVFESIRKARPKRLYIAADAPRLSNNDDIERCRSTRLITENIDWPCEVKRLYQETNLGCSLGPRAAFDSFFSHESEGIILEDDCVPHPDFFPFATAMLDRYRDDKRIISINGSNLGYNLNTGYSYTFSRFMNMWGWATWADRANSIDYSLNQWCQIRDPVWWLYKHMRQNLFDSDINWYKYWKDKFDRTVFEEQISWWDWQWIYHQVKNRQLSVVPARNLVTNIGFEKHATHTKASDNPAANIPIEGLLGSWNHPEEIKYDWVYEELYVKWVWCYHKRLPFSFYVKKGIVDLLKLKF